MQRLIKTLLGLLVIIGMSGCLPLKQELQVMLKQHNLLQKMYISDDTTAYNSYKKNKIAITSLQRAQQYTVVDIKENYARLAKSNKNSLTQDVWVSLRYLEKKPTYFLKLKANTNEVTIRIQETIYTYNMRFPKGKYKIEINSERFLDQSFEIELKQDITKEIDLNIDTVAEKIRLAQEKVKEEKIAQLQAKIKKVIQERKNSIYKDTKQNLMWQDDLTIENIQKPWITNDNYTDKNYNDTSGDTAYSYCKTLNLAGFNDWRLPSKDELKELYTQEHTLQNTTSNWYWSNTTNETLIDRAWAIYLNNSDGFSDQKNTKNFVRCVRVEKR